MRSTLLIPVLTVLLGACQASAPEPTEEATPSSAATAPATAAPSPSPLPTPSPSTPNVAITELGTLTGEYRVAGADGRDIDLPHAITARFDDTGVIVESGCVQLSWVWFFEGARLVTEQLFPRASCGRGLISEEEAIVTAFNTATAVGRTPANGIE